MSAGILAAVATAGKARGLPGLAIHVPTAHMRAVVQRVSARRSVDRRRRGSPAQIDRGPARPARRGSRRRTAADLAYIVDKIVNLRIFADDAGKMNRSVLDVGGGVLVVSQFTLYGDARQGRRPAFTGALEPVAARALYEQVARRDPRSRRDARAKPASLRPTWRSSSSTTGPVTILLDSRKGF